jgi:hypothetical protein
MLINRNTRAKERFRKVHVIPSELGKTDIEVNKWINDNRPHIEEIKNITYICLPSGNGTINTKVIIDYVENISNDVHPTTNIEVKEVFPSEEEINKSLCAPPIENIGGIRIVDLSAVKGSDYIAALIDYTV